MSFYKNHWERWTEEEKTKCPWSKVERRFLKQNEKYLQAAWAMQEHGLLFALDREGNPLIADKGDLLMKGENYQDTLDNVRLDFFDASGVLQPTLYEMFIPSQKGEDLPFEVKVFERFTQGPFVPPSKNPDQERNSCWLYAGEILGLMDRSNRDFHKPLPIILSPGIGDNQSRISSVQAWRGGSPRRGVRRLLRLQAI